MALTIPHNSQAGIAVAGGGRAAPYVSESAFMTPGQRVMPEALNRFAAGLDKAGGTVNDLLLERQRMQNATDLLADKIEYEDALRDFDSNYRQTKQGPDARTAAEDYAAFHNERLELLQKKWGGNPYLMESVARMAEGIRAPSMNRALAFRDRQEEAHREAVGKAEWQRTSAKLADPALTYAEREKALADSNNSLRMLAGQRPVFNAQGEVTGWSGGRNVDAEIERRRQAFHTEQVETLLAQGRTGEASEYVRGHSGDFGERSNDMLAKIRAADEHNAARAEAEAKRQREAALDGVYSGWRAEARKLGLTLEESESFIAGRISEDLADPDSRKHAMGRLKDDLRVETMRRDAGDMAGLMQAEKATKGMLPSQKIAWLDQNWQGSPAGRAKAEEALTQAPKLTTPENVKRYNDLRIMIDLGRIGEPEEVSAKAFEFGLTTQQAEAAQKYLENGGQAGQVTVSAVQTVWNALNKPRRASAKTPPMPPDLPDLVIRELQSSSPGKAVTSDLIYKTVSKLALNGETDGSGWFSDGETYAESLRNNRGGAWLPIPDAEQRKRAIALMYQEGARRGLSEAQIKDGLTDEAIAQVVKEEILQIRQQRR